jgi:hypothetical protein
LRSAVSIPATIEKYEQLWDSITAAARLRCPFCYTHTNQDKRSARSAKKGRAFWVKHAKLAHAKRSLDN